MDPLTGGPCQGIRSSSPALEKLGVHRQVVCFDSPDAAYLGIDSFPIHPLGKGVGPWQYNSKLIPWLHDNLHHFDVVITNGLWIYHSNAVRQVLTKLKQIKLSEAQSVKPLPKWFIMPHGMLDPYFQRAPDRKLKAIRNWFYWKLIEHKVIEQANGLLFTCETELLMAQNTFRPYQPQREINVGYGVEAPPAYTDVMRKAFAQKCPDLEDKPFILFLSRIHPKKGVDMLLKAYTSLADEFMSTRTSLPKLVIAGPGIDTDFGKSIRKIAHRNPAILSNIYFAGMLSGDAKWGAFYGCEAFILPSHQENFGIAVAEALACSKPVLISNQVNIWREIITVGGGIVESNSLDGTYSLLNTWMRLSFTEKREMSEKARFAYEKFFKVESAANSFLSALKH